jgi:hypothetical protein
MGFTCPDYDQTKPRLMPDEEMAGYLETTPNPVTTPLIQHIATLQTELDLLLADNPLLHTCLAVADAHAAWIAKSLVEALNGVKALLQGGGEFGVVRADGESMGAPDEIRIACLFEKCEAALAAYHAAEGRGKLALKARTHKVELLIADAKKD